MYAIARIAGKQFRLETDTTIKVPKLPLEVGDTYEIYDLLFLTDGQKARIGSEAKGLTAIAKVIRHGRDDKIIVHRKKRRKGFQVTRGHRQQYTLLHIEKIGDLAAQKPAAKPKAEAPPKKSKSKAESKAKAKPKAEPRAKTSSKAKAAKPKAKKGK
jgi:large subunit ribosomal protein L21